jgi:hypothetical protein
MYTYIGLGLISVFAMMIIPSNFDTVNNELVFYGAGTITQYDKDGNEMFSQTIHNQVVNTGEDFLIDQTFQDSVTLADNEQIGSICIFEGTPTVAETTTAASFDSANTIAAGRTNCKEDTTVTTSGSIATVNPATFTCGGTNCDNGDTISAFAVCQNDATDDLDFEDCATEGVLFAIIDSTDTTLAASETLSITYNFDITSGSS